MTLPITTNFNKQGTYSAANQPDSAILVSDVTTIEDALNNDVMPIDGSNALTGELDAGGNRVKNVGDAMDGRDAAPIEQIYPVGCVYTSTVGTNPALIFGFGTWVQFGEGQMMIGHSTTDADFGTAEATGGNKTHTLVQAELPSVSPTVNDPGHTHPVTNDGIRVSAAGGNYDSGANTFGSDVLTAASNTTGITIDPLGSDTPMDIMNPHVVVYFFKRTA